VERVSTFCICEQLVERPPELHEYPETHDLRPQEPGFGPFLELGDHPWHRHDEPQVHEDLPPAVDPSADDEDDEVPFDLGGEAAVDGGPGRGTLARITRSGKRPIDSNDRERDN
jgi:hypothetical protein